MNREYKNAEELLIDAGFKAEEARKERRSLTEKERRLLWVGRVWAMSRGYSRTGIEELIEEGRRLANTTVDELR